MVCPRCGGETRRRDTVKNHKENEIYRKKECTNDKCGYTFFTVEYEVAVNKRFKKDWCNNYRSTKNKH